MESSHLRRKDTTKGPPLRVLSLDGGGVRGYSMLILLQELMYRTYVEIEGKAPKRDQIPKPCDHFDLIAGTGTGGLIAIMLGRLRLDVETCKDVYVRMTKRVFETDKTIAGIPYRSTLFKASKLEEAIRECVREHTGLDDEGNDGPDPTPTSVTASPITPVNLGGGIGSPRRTLSRASNVSGMSSPYYRSSMIPMRWGNPNAPLYDTRENRTKTAVTAIYKGTPMNGTAALLRSYDSRKEPPPEFNCTIWQAGRATCATALAFKPIQIGQSVFIDEGAGRYNPAPQILDEASVNEWPGRDMGVFLTIGTGKRPAGTSQPSHLWWEDFVSGSMGDFAEARKRLIAKIEGCEETHQYMLKEHLARRGVDPDNYYRLNVEVGVGEFGMNEWNRLADISTNTRKYLAKSEVQRIILDAATKMAKIHRARIRFAAAEARAAAAVDMANERLSFESGPSELSAYELPGVDVQGPFARQRQSSSAPSRPHYQQLASSQDKFAVLASDEAPQVVEPAPPRRASDGLSPARASSDYHSPPRSSNGSFTPSPRRSGEGRDYGGPTGPPLPPKTPLPYPDDQQFLPVHPLRITKAAPGYQLPYPDTDGPPPAINTARKPEYGYR